MNKKGFTLIELLAVIVILAIIALIATPIVLNIIDDAKKESELRSAEFYLKSLELSIAQATLNGTNIKDNVYNILKNGNICLEKYEGEICKDEDGNLKNNELIVEVKGKVPDSGTIVIENGQIGDVSLNLDDKLIVKDENGELEYKSGEPELLGEICELQNDSAPSGISAGDKYSCKVDPNKDPYTFYVVSYLDKDGNIISDKANAVSVNLIMDRNLGDLIQWGPSSEEDSFGPISALDYLEGQTNSWTNADYQTYDLNYYSNKSLTRTNVRARLLTPEEAYSLGCLELESGGCPSWIFSTDESYWLSSAGGCPEYAYSMEGEGYLDNESMANSDSSGVRPVINLKMN